MKKVLNKNAVLGLTLSMLTVACGQAPAPLPMIPTGAAGVGLPAGCLPINAPIGISGTGAYFSPVRVSAGRLPNAQHGTLNKTSGGTVGSYTTLANRYDGSVSLNITPGVNGLGTTLNGQIVLSQAAQNRIITNFAPYSMPGAGYAAGIPTPGITTMPYQQSLCVTDVGLDLAIGNGGAIGGSTTTLYNGYVYLYLNVSQGQPAILNF